MVDSAARIAHCDAMDMSAIVIRRLRGQGIAASVLALLGIMIASTATAAPFDVWLDGVRVEARERGVPSSVVDRALSGVRPLPKVISLDRKQPEFTQTFWRYLDSRVTADRVAKGKNLMARHVRLLQSVERRYRVPARVLVALWGLETSYGQVTGKTPMFSALATLAHDPRRDAFFREQLMAALEGAARGDIPYKARSSWAGAFGQPQFMPTTYRDHAVDFDGDGRRDLWNSLPDIFASAANYLAASGWRWGEKWGREVQVPARFDYSLSGADQVRPLAEWSSLGLRSARGGALPTADMSAALVLPGGAVGAPALLAYDNYRVILMWNKSDLYAVSVGHLADLINGGGPFMAPRPAREEALSQAQVREMQRHLIALGYDTGGVDGIVGSQTRAAIRDFQVQASPPADGFPSVRVLNHLRRMAAR